MRRLLVITALFFITIYSFASAKDSVINYLLPDSVKATSFMAEFTVQDMEKKKYSEVGIMTDVVGLSIKKFPIGSSINFQAYNSYQKPIAKGLDVRDPNLKTESLSFYYDWKIGEAYKLMISQATDSAGNFSLYSGYVFLPKENKWKLIGTFKFEGRWNSLQRPTFFYGGRKKPTISVSVQQVWCQRQNGLWKNMLQTNFTPPVLNLYSHLDSIEQLLVDKNLITKAIAENKTDAKQEHDGIYYTIMKEGTGKQVSVNDTVIAYYKGYLLKDGSVFDSTKEKPATFPLNRLIKGWQIGVPLCKVGGKIRLVIPSNLAYSIRTRAAKIPPNSILVFEIEVVDAKSPQ